MAVEPNDKAELLDGGRRAARWASEFEAFCKRALEPKAGAEAESLRDAGRFAAFIGVVAGLLSIVVRGFEPTLFNGAIQIPKLRHLMDPSLYPNDLLMMGLANYHSLLWDLMALLGAVLPLAVVLFGFFVVQQVLVHGAIAYLGTRLGAGRFAAGLAAFALIPWTASGIGNSTWSGISIHHNTLAFGFLLLALAFLVERRFAFAGAAWGLGALVHLPNAFYAGVGLALVGLWAVATHPGGLKRALPGAALGVLLLAAGTALSAWRVFDGAGAFDMSMGQLREATRNHSGPHIFIGDHWGEDGNPGYGLRMALAHATVFVLLMWAAWRALPSAKALALAALGGAAVIAGGIVGVEVLQSVPVGRLMLLRAGDWLAFLMLFAPWALVGLWAGGRLRLWRWGAGPFAFAWALAMNDWYGNEEWALAALGVLLFSLAVWGIEQRRGGALGLPVNERAPLWWRVAPVRGRSMVVLCGFLLVGLLHAFQAEVGYIQQPYHGVELHGHAEHRARMARTTSTAAAWRDAQLWARDNTPKDAVFLVFPADPRGWRTFSERSPFVEVRDGHAAVLHPDVGPEVVRRLHAMGYAEVPPTGSWVHIHTDHYMAIPEEDLLRLGREEGVDYAVLFEGHALELLEPVYENRRFLIVPLRP